MKNDWKKTFALVVGCILIGVILGGGSVYWRLSAVTERSRELVRELDRENQRLAGKIGEIQRAVETVSEGIAGAAGGIDEVAGTVEDIAEGLADFPGILRELVAFIRSVESVVSSGLR